MSRFGKMLQSALWIVIALGFVVIFALYPDFISELGVIAVMVVTLGTWLVIRLFQQRPTHATATDASSSQSSGRPLMIWGGALLVGAFLWAFASMSYGTNTWNQVIFVMLGPAMLLLVAGATLLGIGAYKAFQDSQSRRPH